MTAASWATFSPPAIVAEALVAVDDALRTSLRPGPAAAAAAVVAGIAAGLAPPAAPDPLPAWLRPEQRRPVARALASLRLHRGALLACHTGSGKTYMALAVAAAWPAGPIVCVIPAALDAQWADAARRKGVELVPWSHERLSRGRLPPVRAGLVIVDESHHFRHPSIARYRHLADYLVGCPALLLSATPVVNRPEDLAHQLRLTVRDDALAADGLTSLDAPGSPAQAALGAIVITDTLCRDDRPVRRRRRSAPEPDDAGDAGDALLPELDTLALSRERSVAMLIRGGLLQAAASSPAALAAALRRYRALLRHAADARAAGRAPSRAAIRRCAGRDGGQLVLWSLVADETERTELAIDDLDRLDALIATAIRLSDQPDPKLDRLRALMADQRPTIVFTAAVDTVAYLRRRLTAPVAWCTGARAGIGRVPLARAALLRTFAPTATDGPRVLITTDVAAEGLDLQRAARVVHYDLPWTSTRLDQREGRAVRLGSSHREVDVIRFDPPAGIERRLRRLAAIAASASAPGHAGVAAGDEPWRWREDLTSRFPGPAAAGTAAVAATERGALIGWVIEGLSGEGSAEARTLVGAAAWVGADGIVDASPPAVAGRLEHASRAARRTAAPGEAAAALDLMSPGIGVMIRQAQRARWTCTTDAAARDVTRRLRSLAADAARRRDSRTLARIERALAILSGALTAGEARLIQRVAAAGEGALLEALDRLPGAAPLPPVLEARVTGILLFGPAD